MQALQKIAIKLYARAGTEFAPAELIPLLHGWIQKRSVEGTLIDVADYSHVPDGPGLMLIAYEGVYSFEAGSGAPGLVYSNRRGLEDGDLGSRVKSSMRLALAACEQYGRDADASDGGVFPGSSWELISNDRLLAPATDLTYDELEPVVSKVCEELYGETKFRVARLGGGRERAALRVDVDEPFSPSQLLERLA